MRMLQAFVTLMISVISLLMLSGESRDVLARGNGGTAVSWPFISPRGADESDSRRTRCSMCKSLQSACSSISARVVGASIATSAYGLPK